MNEDEAALHARVWEYVRRHDCYLKGWDWANRREGSEKSDGSDCRNVVRDSPGPNRQEAPPATEDQTTSEGRTKGDGRTTKPTQGSEAEVDAEADAQWDAGDMACGDLVLELRRRIQAVKPGERLRLTARDPAAPEDIPAWCGLTRHLLIEADHPSYLIQRKEN